MYFEGTFSETGTWPGTKILSGPKTVLNPLFNRCTSRVAKDFSTLYTEGSSDTSSVANGAGDFLLPFLKDSGTS